jgi:uncharacterized protein YecE (DUF72 family)
MGGNEETCKSSFTSCTIYVGPAGWSYEDWKGAVYPSKGRGFDPLEYLSSIFQTIEINSTFYRPPTPRQTSSWCKRVSHNPSFRFTAKLYRGFTHKPEELNEGDREAVLTGMAPLVEEGRLGALLVQFPYSFHNTEENRRWLKTLCEDFGHLPLVVEVRHGSWNRPEFFRLLEDLGVGFCNIDQPRVSYSMGRTKRVTSPVAYLRLHGRNKANWFREDAGSEARYDYLYNDEELDEIARWAVDLAQGAQELYVVTNNHFRGQAVCNAIQLMARLPNQRLYIPELLSVTFPKLKELKDEAIPTLR